MGFSDFFLGSQGTPGEHGIDYAADYEDYQGIRDSLNNYWQGLLGGQEPSWLTNYSNQILESQLAGLNRDYYGDPGNRSGSAFGNAMEVGAQTGVGPKAATANANKVNWDLMAKKAAAREAMNKYRMSWMGGAVNQAGSNMLGLPQGQRAFQYNVQPTAGTPGFLQYAAQGLGQGIGGALGGGLTSGLGSLFSSGGGGALSMTPNGIGAGVGGQFP